MAKHLVEAKKPLQTAFDVPKFGDANFDQFTGSTATPTGQTGFNVPKFGEPGFDQFTGSDPSTQKFLPGNEPDPFQRVAERFGGQFEEGAFTSDRTGGEFTGEGNQEFPNPISLLPGETADEFFNRILAVGGVDPDRVQTDRPAVEAPAEAPPPPPKSKVTLEGDADSLDPGTPGGISSLFATPQISSPEDKRLTDLLGQFTAGIVSPEDRQIQESQLISQVQEGSAARRSELAERLGGAGVFGGVARNELGRVFGQSERGLATGLAGIQSNILNKNLAGKTKALETLFQLQGLSSEEAREQARLAAGTNRLNLDAELGRGQLELDKIKTKLSNDLSQGRLDLDTAALDFEVALRQEDDSIAREQMTQDFVLFLMDMLQRVDDADKERIMDLLRQFGGVN